MQKDTQTEAGLTSDLSAELGCTDNLDERMKAAGMIPVSEILKGSLMDKWHVHTGVVDLESFSKWLDIKLEEMLKLKARIELKGDAENNELYECVLSHCAVLTAVRCNFKAATGAA